MLDSGAVCEDDADPSVPDTVHVIERDTVVVATGVNVSLAISDLVCVILLDCEGPGVTDTVRDDIVNVSGVFDSVSTLETDNETDSVESTLKEVVQDCEIVVVREYEAVCESS